MSLDKIYLVGGGPSLRFLSQEDWHNISDMGAGAINTAIKVLPKSEFWFFLDKPFADEYLEIYKCKNMQELKLRFHIGRVISPHYPEDSFFLFESGEKYVEEVIQIGYITGFMAISYLLHLGYKKIILLGFDFGNENYLRNEAYHANNLDPQIAVFNRAFVNFKDRLINVRGNQNLICAEYSENLA